MSKSNMVRMGLMGSAAALALMGATSTAQAVETKFGDVSIVFDTTVSVGASMKTQDRITQFLPETNGGPIDPRANVALGATGVAAVPTPVGFGGAPCVIAQLGAGCGGVNVYNTPFNNFDGSINSDDGRLNFDSGDFIGANAKANHDLVVKWHNYTIFARAVGFYDVIMTDEDVGARSKLTDAGIGDVGRNYELLDAFISADYMIADLPVNLRLGKQVINWGESTFILGGNNVFNPIDVGAFRRPGSEIKEALLPVNAFSGSISLPFDVSLSGYYALDWEPFELDPSGTPFSGSDLVTLGGGVGGNQRLSFVTSSPTSGARRNCTAAAGTGTKFVQTSGLINNPLLSAAGPDNNFLLECNDSGFINYQTPFPIGQQELIRIGQTTTLAGEGVTVGTSGLLARGNDVFGDDSGQFGISARWYAESLGGTEFGLYYQNYHSRLPIASIGVTPGAQAQLQFSINGDNTSRSAGGIGGRQLPPAGCGLSSPFLVGQIANPGVVVLDADPLTPGNQTVLGAGLTMAISSSAIPVPGAPPGTYGPLGNPATPGTAANQMVNTPVLDPGNVLPTAAAALALLSGGTFQLNPTNGFKTQLAVTQLNCALAYYQSGFVNPGTGTTIQAFDGAEFLLGAGGGELFFTYPEDIAVLGASFNTTAWGWGIQGDFTYRDDAPFQVDGDSLTIAALVNGCVFSQFYAAAGGVVNSLATQTGDGSTPSCGSRQTVANGVLRNQMYTGQIGTTATFTASDWWVDAMGADLGIFVSEVGMVLVPGVESTWLSNNVASYRGAQYANTGCQGTDLPGAGILGLDVKTSQQCRPTDFSAGMVMLLSMQYNNAFDTGFLISPTIAYSYDFMGTTPAPYGNYVEDRQSVNLSINGTLNNNFRVGASYTNFFSGHNANKARDQDFASITASYTY